jgi:OmpA-OmpF porin, OOP family
MKNLLFVLILMFVFIFAKAQQKSDTEWQKNFVVLQNSQEGDFLIRLGDVDNLGFGWDEGFNPFMGGVTNSHSFPWETNPADVPGMDRILLPLSYKGEYGPCGNDGYSGSWDPKQSKARVFNIPLAGIKGATIREAAFQVFIDDFQSPSYCSRFIARVNGLEFKELTQILNKIDQTGPVGKLVSVKIPAYLMPELKKDTLKIYIDDIFTKASDGFAIDFIRLIINPKAQFPATIKVSVKSCITEEAIGGATVELQGFGTYTTDNEGELEVKNMPAGYYVMKVSAPNYAAQYQVNDIYSGDERFEFEFCLKEPKILNFKGRKFSDEEKIGLNQIQFAASSSKLSSESLKELDLLVAFMNENPDISIELAGYTSSEGDERVNIELSLERVNSCKKYMVDKGVEHSRIFTIGYGPANPVAPNDTEEGRLKNRRVEFGIKNR